MKNKDEKNLVEQKIWFEKHKDEIVRAELNIFKMLSVWETSNSKKKSKIIERKRVLPNGDIEIQRIIIGMLEKTEVGVFKVKKHLKTLLALFRLYERAGKPTSGKVIFSMHRLAKILDLKWGSSTYRYLCEALEGLAGIPMRLENFFYTKKEEKTEELIVYFRWLDRLEIYSAKIRKSKKTNVALCAFVFNEYINQNLRDGYTKPFLLDTVINFSGDVTILLYNHLDLIMADKTYYERTLKNLIEQDFKLDGNYPYAGNRKFLFEKSVKELKGVKLTTGVLSDIKLERTTDGSDYKIICRKEEPTLALIKKCEVVKPKQEEEDMQDHDMIAAEFLVKLFHSYIDPKTEDYRPNNKELQQATHLLKNHGLKKAKYVVEFAVKQAEKTNFQMTFFGAVLGYSCPALSQFAEEEKAEEEREKAKAKEREEALMFELRDQYRDYRKEEVNKYIEQISPEEYVQKLKECRQKFLGECPAAQKWKDDAVDNMAEVYFENEVESKLDFLSFEKWKAARS